MIKVLIGLKKGDVEQAMGKDLYGDTAEEQERIPGCGADSVEKTRVRLPCRRPPGLHCQLRLK